MIITILVIVILLYLFSMFGIIAHYEKKEPTFINEFNFAWITFIIASVILIIFATEIFKYQYDKQIKINNSVTVTELYDQGYVVVKQIDKDNNIYNVREIFKHTQPLEEIK